MKNRKFSIFIIIGLVIVIAALASRRASFLPLGVMLLLFSTVMASKKRKDDAYEEADEGQETGDRKEPEDAELHDSEPHASGSYDSAETGYRQEHSPIITCEYCGCRVDTGKDACCPHCGGPYHDNPEWKNRKTGKNDANKRSSNRNYDYKKECREALEAGGRALDSLRNAKSCLDSARGWGIFDMMGGGFLSSMVKRSKMSSAQAEMDRAKRDLQSFAKELGDIHMSGQLDIEINDFLGFADLFWDNFFVDWMMQDRINRARAQVDDCISRVERIIRRLHSESGWN